MREGMELVLNKSGHRVLTAEDGMLGAELFRSQRPDLVITDLKLPGKSGMELLQEFRAHAPDTPVILISAFGTIDLAVNAVKLGARDFIEKPFSIEELTAKIKYVLDEAPTKKRPTLSKQTKKIVGSSPVMAELMTQVEQIARVNSPVLITGESGTGKEVMARAIHEASGRQEAQMLAINCSALTDTLLESELFGHEKGAFTGAHKQHRGIFEQAHGGSILLDEIGDISPQLQVKLLRVLQEQSFQRVGGTETIKVDVRVMAATNRDLEQAMEAGSFREDLFFRLNVIPLSIPPLRQRMEDIPELVSHFVARKCAALEKDIPNISEATLQKMVDHDWPGNIRELENFLERLLVFHVGDEIKPEQLVFGRSRTNGPTSGKLNDVMEHTEIEMIRDALVRSAGVRQEAARQLGIKTSTLYYKMEKYGLFEEFGGKQGDPSSA